MQHRRGMVRQLSEENGQGLIASIIGSLAVILRGIAGAAGGGWWISNRAAWSFEHLSEDDRRAVGEPFL